MSSPQLGIIFFENKTLGTVINLAGGYPNYTSGTENCPTMVSLANTYRIANPYSGVTDPSLPNYCGFGSGSFLGCNAVDTPPNAVDGFAGNQPNIFAQIQDAGHTWKNYAEDITYWDSATSRVKDFYPGDTAWKTNSTVPYCVNRHVPSLFYAGPDNITQKPVATASSGIFDFRVPTGAGTWTTGTGTLLADMASGLPDFFVINPNLPDCGHGYTVGASSSNNAKAANADHWLTGTSVIQSGGTWSYSQATPKFPGVTALLAAMRPGATLIITFDNDGAGTGPIYTCIAGSPYTGGGAWTPPAGATANHFWLLWSIEKFFSLSKLPILNLDGSALTFPQETRYTSLTVSQALPLVATASSTTLTPTSFSFPTAIAPGSSSAEQIFSLDNNGNATLNVASVVIDDTTNFTISSGGGVTAVAANSSASIGIKFTPPANATHGATFTVHLTVTDDDGGIVGSTQQSTITATTTSVANTPHATLSPPAGTVVSMGTVTIGTTSTTNVTITNDGTASMTITGITIGPSTRPDSIPSRFTTTQ